MGSRERPDEATKAHHSTAALLQERFRELQRKKEMREERQLRRMPATTATTHRQPSSSRSPPHVSLTLWPVGSEDSHESHTRGSQTPPSSNYPHAQSPDASWNNVCDCGSDSGVDTSLHL